MSPEQVIAELTFARLMGVPMTAADVIASNGPYSAITGKGWRYVWFGAIESTKEASLGEFTYVAIALLPSGTFFDRMIRIDSAVLLCKRGLVALRPKSVRVLRTAVHQLYVDLKSKEVARLAAGPLISALKRNVHV